MRLKSLFGAFFVLVNAEKCKNGGTKIAFKNEKTGQVSRKMQFYDANFLTEKFVVLIKSSDFFRRG